MSISKLDIDNLVGFWVKNVPYIWVGGKTKEDCVRYYITSDNDVNYIEHEGQLIPSEQHLIEKLPLAPIYFFKLKNIKEDCRWISDYFRVYNRVSKKIKNLNGVDIRVEGKKINPFDLFDLKLSDGLLIINKHNSFIDVDDTLAVYNKINKKIYNENKIILQRETDYAYSEMYRQIYKPLNEIFIDAKKPDYEILPPSNRSKSFFIKKILWYHLYTHRYNEGIELGYKMVPMSYYDGTNIEQQINSMYYYSFDWYQYTGLADFFPNIYENQVVPMWPYPYKIYREEDLEFRFENLQQHKLDISTGNYKVFNLLKIPDAEKFLHYQGKKQYMKVKSSDFSNMDDISDHFVEEVRVKSVRYDQQLSSYDYWFENMETVVKHADQKYKTLSKYSLRESLYELHMEVTSFKPSLMRGLVQHFGMKKVLDISAGWGDRLIGAMAANVDFYCGVDPNPLLHDKYQQMIEFFDFPLEKFKLIKGKFENVKLPDVLFDGCISSPPYFDLENYYYGENVTKEKESLDGWFNNFLMPSIKKALSVIKKGGHLIINMNNVKGKPDFTIRMVKETNMLNVEYLGCLPQWTGDPKKSAQPFWIWQKK